MKPRYEAEESGAVLDTLTGLREWFNSRAEAIKAAKQSNQAVSKYMQQWNERSSKEDAS